MLIQESDKMANIISYIFYHKIIDFSSIKKKKKP